mgnify:FL=1
MPIISCILSILVHGLILVFGFYAPFSGHKTYVDLEKPVYEVELVREPPPPSLKQTEQAAAPKPKAATLKKKAPRIGPKSAAAVKIARKPKKKPSPENQRKKPEPSPQKPKSKPKKAPEPETLAPTPEKVLEEAMADIEKETMEQKEPPARDYLAEAMAAIEQDVQARGSDEAASAQAESSKRFYGSLVKNLIKKQWRFPGVDDSGSLKARVEIQVNADGKIIDSTLLDPSGRPDFDRSVLKAIAETKQALPVPEDITTIEVTFHSREIE